MSKNKSKVGEVLVELLFILLCLFLFRVAGDNDRHWSVRLSVAMTVLTALLALPLAFILLRLEEAGFAGLFSDSAWLLTAPSLIGVAFGLGWLVTIFADCVEWYEGDKGLHVILTAHVVFVLALIGVCTTYTGWWLILFVPVLYFIVAGVMELVFAEADENSVQQDPPGGVSPQIARDLKGAGIALGILVGVIIALLAAGGLLDIDSPNAYVALLITSASGVVVVGGICLVLSIIALVQWTGRCDRTP